MYTSESESGVALFDQEREKMGSGRKRRGNRKERQEGVSTN